MTNAIITHFAPRANKPPRITAHSFGERRMYFAYAYNINHYGNHAEAADQFWKASTKPQERLGMRLVGAKLPNNDYVFLPIPINERYE